MSKRICPFEDCGKAISHSAFACPKHWSAMSESDRKSCWLLYEKWKGCQISAEDFKAEFTKIMLRYKTVVLPDVIDAVSLAKLVVQYIAKRKEYTNANQGLYEKKRSLGMELSRLETKLGNMAHLVLHPPQVQPTLFETGGPEQTGLPD